MLSRAVTLLLFIGTSISSPTHIQTGSEYLTGTETPKKVGENITTPFTSLNCGAHELSAGSYEITSPNYPSNYGSGYNCEYELTPGSGAGSIAIACSAFDVESADNCRYDVLNVNGEKFCGTTGPSLTSSAPGMIVEFKTDSSVTRSGFSCTVTVSSGSPPAVPSDLGCGAYTVDVGTYTITSPNHPSDYENYSDCHTTVSAGENVRSLSIECSEFNLEAHSSCRYDYLSVDDSKFCGTTGPQIQSSDKLTLVFHSDRSIVKSGYTCSVVASSNSPVTPAPSGDCECGKVNRATRVVGGDTTEMNEYPWQAGLVSPGGTRTWCGGILINNLYVLTAAHCTDGKSASQLQVLLGDHRISQSDGESRHIVSRIIQHASYVSAVRGYDYSLLKLSQPVQFNEKRRPACLPSSGNSFAGVTAIATGFGRVGATQPQATVLQEVELQVWSQSSCASVWSVTDTMLCAGGSSQGGKSVCMGDSGGPLVALENNKYSVIGVVSFGRPCANANVPDVFGRVTAVLPWISQNTADATYCS